MGKQFEDKVVLITGGSRGLGRAMAEGLPQKVQNLRLSVESSIAVSKPRRLWSKRMARKCLCARPTLVIGTTWA